ncbi:MAG: transglutaminase domain-containing protein [Candidatus Thorarchaeota archaeon]
MSAAVTTDDKRMGATTIISSLILVAMIVWATYSFVLVQFGWVRAYDPHTTYDDTPVFDYNINWSGGRSNWFENINYTDVPMDLPFPDDLLGQMENTLFYVAPEDPPQLWRSTAYDSYDGSGWSKTSLTQVPLAEIDPSATTNQIYRVYLNVTPGQSGGSIELPALFPEVMIIQNSFETGTLVGGAYQPDTSSRLQSYELYTDDYGTALQNPFFVNVPAGESLLLSYLVSYEDQDLLDVANRALNGDQAPPAVSSMYSTLPGVTLTQRVIDNASQFLASGNAYQTAVAVDSYFRSGIFELILDNYNDRPPAGQEVTDWFLERGGGLPMDFATAYCVFLRYLNIPARMALGYAVGDAMGGYREIKVRHMMFWAEVFVPMTGHPDGGEWIQVLPIPLPGSMGGGQDPANTGSGNAELWVWPSVSPPWVPIGTNFSFYALLMVDYVPVSTPETIFFYDNTDSVAMGSAQIQPGAPPLATLPYQFPVSSTIGPHNISVTYVSAGFSVSNWTIVSATSTPIPMVASSEPEKTFFLSETIDIDIKLALDNYTAHWNDTLNIRGIMTDEWGQPVDGTTLNNPWMQTIWDGVQLGSARIQSDGSYLFPLYIDGTNATLMSLMTPGVHDLWAYYAGENDTVTGLPIYLPVSSNRSTVTMYGLATSNLLVTPNPAWRGATLHYEGTLQLFNGTILAFESVDIYFNGTYLTTRVTNVSGFFQYDYPIAIDQTLGWANAYVNWTSTIAGVSDSSDLIPVEIRRRPTDLSNVDSWPRDPMAVHILQNITIYGNLLDGVNGTGLVGKTVDFWWDDGTSVVSIGSNTTVAGGYYEYTYTVPSGYEGFVDYWVTFTSPDTYYDDTQSPILTIEVKKWDVDISIFADPDPVYQLGTMTIQGVVTFPEIPWPFEGARLTIWWYNATDGLHNLTSVVTNSTGGYVYYHQVPLNHEEGNVTLYASFISPYPNVNDAESPHLYPIVEAPTTLVTVSSNGSVFYLNETVHIYGQVLFGGFPLSGGDVTIYWSNSTDTLTFPDTTNFTGHYELFYPLSPGDGEGTITVTVDHSVSGASGMLVPSLWTQLYQTDISVNAINGTYHLDEVLYYTGTLTFVHNGNPIPGATITVWYSNSTGTYPYTKVTDATGSFSFQYNFSLTDALGGIWIWSEYTSSDPLWSDAISVTQGSTIILYDLELNAVIPPTIYIDQGLLIQGTLTYLGGFPPLVGENVDIFISRNMGGPWALVASPLTNDTGFFTYTHYFTVPPDTEGSYYFKCNYTSTSPYNNDATTPPIEVIAERYPVMLDVLLLPNPVYQNETLTVQAHLYFAHNGSGIAGATIVLYWFNGTTHRLDDIPLVTDGTGWVSYVYSEMDEDSVRSGIEVYAYFAGTPFIEEGETLPHPTLTLLQWQTVISGFDAGVSPYNILQTIPISGTLTYVIVPEPIGGTTVQILVDRNPVGPAITASDGSFTFNWPIPETTVPGQHAISASFVSPWNWVADYTTPPLIVDILRYPVDLTATADTYVVYRGNSVTISGNLRFTNGSGMAGYQVDIHWVNGTDWVVQTITITDAVSGSYAYVHPISWEHPVGMSQYYVAFNRPNLAFETASTVREAIEVRDQVLLLLDAQSQWTVERGSDLIISGSGTDGGRRVAFVPIQILADGNVSLGSIITESDGTFTMTIQVPATATKGTHNISLQVDPSSYFDSIGPSDFWLVDVFVDTIVSVGIPQPYEVLPGENITVSILVQDVDTNPVLDADVSIYLGTDHLADVTVPDSGDTFQVTIPSDWTESSVYPVSVVYGGDAGQYVLNSTGQSTDMVHFIANVNFDFGATPQTVINGTDFTISVILTDELGTPIRYRDVTLNLNQVTIVPRTTDSNGAVTLLYRVDPVGAFTVSATLLSAEVTDRDSQLITIDIVPPGPGLPGLLDLLLPLGAISVAVVVVFLYLYFVRGFGRGLISSPASDLARKMRRIKKLADQGKYSAAISLTYRTFEDTCGTNTGVTRLYSETARDYVDRVLKEVSLDDFSVIQLLQAYEEARFSDHELTRDRYEDTMRVFTDLYPQIEAVSITEPR